MKIEIEIAQTHAGPGKKTSLSPFAFRSFSFGLAEVKPLFDYIIVSFNFEDA